MFLIEEMAIPDPIIKYLASGTVGATVSSILNTGSLGSANPGYNMTVPTLPIGGVSFAGPTVASVNGKTMLEFSQSGTIKQRLRTTGLTLNLTGNKTYFLVARYTDTGAKGRIFTSVRTGGDPDNWLLGHHLGRSCIAYTNTAAYLNGVEASATYNSPQFRDRLYIYCLTQSLTNTTLYVQGSGSEYVFKGSLPATTQIPTNLLIGGTNNNGFATAELSDCYFGEARVYDGVLSPTNIQTIMTELKGYWEPDALAPPTELLITGTLTIADSDYNGTDNIDPSKISGTLTLNPAGIDPTKPVTMNVTTPSTYSSSAAGSYVITVDVSLSDTANYSVTSPTVNANINKLTITASGVTLLDKDYDGDNSAPTSGTPILAGVISSDINLVSASASATFNDLSGNVGNAKAVTIEYPLSGLAAGNYSLDPGSGFANIIAKALTVSGITADDKVFDTTTIATISGTPNLSGVVDGQTVTADVASANFNTPDVGNNKPVIVTFTLSGGPTIGNYTLADITLYADITSQPQPEQQTQVYRISSTTDTSASGVTSCIETTSMRQSKAQGTFKPADSQAWIRYKKGLCARSR